MNVIINMKQPKLLLNNNCWKQIAQAVVQHQWHQENETHDFRVGAKRQGFQDILEGDRCQHSIKYNCN